jgi:hypothetical protein
MTHRTLERGAEEGQSNTGVAEAGVHPVVTKSLLEPQSGSSPSLGSLSPRVATRSTTCSPS